MAEEGNTNPKHPNPVWQKYTVEGDSVKRANKFCPKCGPGVFLAQAKDRSFCGKCTYTEFAGSKDEGKKEAESEEKKESKEEKAEKKEE